LGLYIFSAIILQVTAFVYRLLYFEFTLLLAGASAAIMGILVAVTTINIMDVRLLLIEILELYITAVILMWI
jgi:membrane associated rhomboid family serine protease